MISLATFAIFCCCPAFAEQDVPAKIIQEQHGNITNIKIEGSLAPTQMLDCISLKDALPTYTPPDLHTAVIKCISIGNYDSASKLFMLAGIFSRFDAGRIVDRTAQAGGQVLIMNSFGTLNAEQRAAFSKAANPLSSDTAERQDLCQNVRRIGHPTYFPKYLILHGLNAYMSKTPLDNALLNDFSAKATWESLQDTYLHCPK